MKKLFLMLPVVVALELGAQTYSVDWYKIAGGGGTSTGAVYSVSGTIGQHEASVTPMTNGQFSLTGGFWVLPQAVPVTGAPALSIAPAGPAQASISWTPATPGWVLQENLNLGTTNWINSASGATNPITVSITNATKFYRLFKP